MDDLIGHRHGRRAQRPADHIQNDIVKHAEEQPHSDSRQSRRCRLLAPNGKKERQIEPECNVHHRQQQENHNAGELFGRRRYPDKYQPESHHQEAKGEKHGANHEQR
ncbi:hypothetical protein SDC9_160183 [bioreactor metagenome]|uniref:Uncharacterized protein n=1 Tax=bioreactor metagenome TaxID=1076179 RepID=A0A645FKY7_9ZZZZ